MWTCQKCGEEIEDQFDSCWKCAGPLEGIKLPTDSKRYPPWSKSDKAWVIFLALLVQVMFLNLEILPAFMGTNTARVRYRGSERYQAFKAAHDNPSPATMAAYQEELREVRRYVFGEKLRIFGIMFGAFAVLNGLWIYPFWNYERRPGGGWQRHAGATSLFS